MADEEVILVGLEMSGKRPLQLIRSTKSSVGLWEPVFEIMTL